MDATGTDFGSGKTGEPRILAIAATEDPYSFLS